MSETTRARPRLYPVVAPVCAAGLATVAAAAFAFATTPHSATELAGLAAFLGASLLADRFPVPVDDLDASGVSLAFVFGLSAIVLFGWAAGVLVVFATPLVMQLLDRRPPIRIAYNSFAFALTAASAGLVIAPIDGGQPADTAARVVAATYVCYLVNVLLITAVVARGTGRSWSGLIASSVRKTILPFTLMGSAVLTLVVLWQRAPLLSVALVGPLLAIQLYQRALLRALRAVRLALTDPLTGLGNHRHFHERLARELEHALRYGRPLALCLVDVDDFKRINDRFGHPAGDRVLSLVATRLRQTGEAFRLGGDEFAVLLPGYEESEATTAAESIIDRIAALDLEQMGTITVSAGIAVVPQHARERDELLRLVDSALYWAKEYGKNQARRYRPDVVELAELKRLASGGDRVARLRAAASLARAVDARDVYTGFHSQRVAQLAVRIAVRLGLDREHVELTRLAASLHDLGKLALPEELLRKPGPLTEPERLVLERHPQIGFRMLDSLGIDPVADWVLHHHERWDGHGYPDGLEGEGIPLGARIIFVADAYDAMTSDRLYRARRSPEAALAELVACAGTQFDPAVVAALESELGLEPVFEALPRPQLAAV
ncbi:MAG TPA: diguanylate cyclase [Gaiellaceae bacterium]|jgi:diguanylate cyclase (GGDEF)-like protein|nr:diguanylate cyclase [Gaiellaceae bacterium]